MDQSPDQPLPQPITYQSAPRWPSFAFLKSPGVGMASFILGLIIALGNLILIVVTTVLSQQPHAQQSAAMIVAGCLLFLGMGFALIGIFLGVIGVIQPNRSKLLAIVGLCLNGLCLLGVEGLMVIGFVMKK